MEKHTFHGEVFTGVGRGRYYVGHPEYKKRFLKVVGYVPYPGTLNLRIRAAQEVEERKRLRQRNGGFRIEEFRYRGETFSAVSCFKGRLENQEVALLIVEITHYDDSVLELISPAYLRKTIGLRDGDRVSPTIEF